MFGVVEGQFGSYVDYLSLLRGCFPRQLEPGLKQRLRKAFGYYHAVLSRNSLSRGQASPAMLFKISNVQLRSPAQLVKSFPAFFLLFRSGMRVVDELPLIETVSWALVIDALSFSLCVACIAK